MDATNETPLSVPSSCSSLTTTTSTVTRTTAYALNAQSLLSNLVLDATLESDVICDFNCHGQNVNIKCSSGFYAAVAKPTLCSISDGHTVTIHGIVVSMSTSGVDTVDANGLSVNRLLKITMSAAKSPSSFIGVLTIHLHHTTRLVQIQGSAVMADSTTAPIWFAEKVLLPLFKSRGSISKEHIKGVNDAILALQSSAFPPQNSQPASVPVSNPKQGNCGHCSRSLTGNTCPLPCTNCNVFFHKKCWKPHKCPHNNVMSLCA